MSVHVFSKPLVVSHCGLQRSARQPCSNLSQTCVHMFREKLAQKPRDITRTFRQLQQCRASAVAEAPVASSSTQTQVSQRPTAAETARTIVDLVTYGTVSTVGEDGVPLGTYVSYVLDRSGRPILRLRNDAVHTANLLREPRCSLFVQPGDLPAR